MTRTCSARLFGPQAFYGNTVRLEYVQKPGRFLGMGRKSRTGAALWALCEIVHQRRHCLAIVAGVLLTQW